MKKFSSQIIASILSLWLAVEFVRGVKIMVIPGESSFLGFPLTQRWQVIVIVGLILGLLFFFLKPLLDIITFPLKILTFGLLGLIISMIIIKITDFLFKELIISGVVPLFWTTLIVWGVNLIISFFLPKRRVVKQ